MVGKVAACGASATKASASADSDLLRGGRRHRAPDSCVGLRERLDRPLGLRQRCGYLGLRILRRDWISLSTHRWPGGAAQGSRHPYPSHKDCAVAFCDSAGRIIRISWALSAACLSCFMWAPDRGGSDPAAMRRPDRPALHPYKHRKPASATRHLCFRLHLEKWILRPAD